MISHLRPASLASLLLVISALPTTFSVYNGPYCGDVETPTCPGEPFPGSSFAGVACSSCEFPCPSYLCPALSPDSRAFDFVAIHQTLSTTTLSFYSL